MKRIIISLATVFLFLSVVPESDAFIFKLFRRNRRPRVSQSYQISGNVQQIAQQKANIQASRNRCFHPGGSMGGARYEGVGSGPTARIALNVACFSGMPGSKGPKKQCIAEGVAQGSNGRWYSCRLYQ